MTRSPDRPEYRLRWLDRARGLAVLGMIAFHLGFDLSLFGLAGWNTARDPAWQAFSTLVAGGFLALSGVSLSYAHGEGPLRARAFLRRLVRIAAAAGLVSLATWLAMPYPVRFGILHAIALFSVIALPFARGPWWIAALAALAFLWLGTGGVLPRFEGWWAYPLGLSASPAPAPDYEPALPWLAATLGGVAAARWLPRRMRKGATPGLLGLAGRHSLAIYLLHQPILLAGVWIADTTFGTA